MDVMSRIVLVRHGETIWHAENRYAGSSDIELSDLGRQQAQTFARWAMHAGFSRVYVSPLGRAQATARPLASALGVTPIIDPRIRELHFGKGEGLTSSEMRTRFPEKYAAFCRDPVRNYLPEGEDPIAAVARGRAALDQIASEIGPQGRVLVITHNTLIRLLLCDLLNIETSHYRRALPSLGNLNVTEILLGENTAALLHFNIPLVGSLQRDGS